MTEVRTAAAPSLRRRRLLAAAAAVLALAACGVTMWAGGATDVVPLPGIPVPSPEVTWLVPGLRLLADLAAVVAVGGLLGAAVLAPGDHLLSAAGYRWMRLAGWAAATWGLAALAALPVQLADFLGTPVSGVSPRGVASFVVDVAQGRVLVLVAVLAAVVAVAARTVLTSTGARALLVVALLATLPPAFTSHSAEESDHDLAVTGVALHVLGVVLWAGGLVALLLARQLAGPERATAVQRFSRLALPMALVVAVSGVLTTLTRLTAPGQLLQTGYGIVLLAKTAALLALVALGWWHRRTTLPALEDRPAAFLRLAGVEVLVFAATIGLAAGLARTPLPADTGSDTVAAAADAAVGAGPDAASAPVTDASSLSDI
ncbi:copper resistance D family protein [Geodermatophilus obscurus]|uniref:copper resistance D family protein n=1 Tax=Geodermatophilus obscurus TaxID=1861 RepID=UPI00116098D9|nr:CopD family protein [Geodermatophilus obscurus]